MLFLLATERLSFVHDKHHTGAFGRIGYMPVVGNGMQQGFCCKVKQGEDNTFRTTSKTNK